MTIEMRGGSITDLSVVVDDAITACRTGAIPRLAELPAIFGKSPKGRLIGSF